MRLRRGAYANRAAVAAGTPPPPVGFTPTWRGHYEVQASTSSYTSASSALGAAASDRIVVVGFYIATSSGTVTGVTVGGVTATAKVTTASATTRSTEFWYAAVPSGTTGDIVVTHNATTGTRIALDWWTITGTTQTAPGTGQTAPKIATAQTITTDSFTVPTGGCAFAVTMHNNNADGGETAWTQSVGTGTERTDAKAATGPWFSSYDTLQDGALTITATNTHAATVIQIAAISWGP